MGDIICPICVSLSLTSTVTEGKAQSYLPVVEFYDPLGKFHRHDTNFSGAVFMCSNQHVWAVNTAPPCPAGDYGGVPITLEIRPFVPA